MSKPSSFELRQRLVAIARKEIGTVEIPPGSNTGPRIIQYQRATTYAGTGWKYCAAYVCFCIKRWGEDPDVLEALKLTPAAFEQWRPKTPAAYGFHAWAEEKGLLMIDENTRPGQATLRTGMIVTFDFSHVGLLETDNRGTLYTVEANTSPGRSGNDGGGVWPRDRARSLAKRLIQILPP